MKILLINLLLIFSVSVVRPEFKWDSHIAPDLSISCSKIMHDFFKGQEIFQYDYEKGEFLLKNGYIASTSEPFAEIFSKTPLPRNVTPDFYETNINLRGIQRMVDQFNQWHMGFHNSDYAKISDFLSEASNCISQRIRQISCNKNDRYRSFDGTCNNLRDPLIGSIVTPFSRLLSATYDDGILEERKSVTGAHLTSARTIVDKLFSQPRSTSVSREHLPNIAFFIFGQHFTHDVAGQITMTHEFDADGPIRCCSGDYKKTLPKSLNHYACAPIVIPKNDTFFGPRHLRCHNFVRSQPILPTDGKLSAAEQANRVTGYIDLSLIYGLTKQAAASLRTFRQGLLITNHNNVLPMRKNCVTNDCYYSGDFRVNQTPQLALMSSLFYRLHNQLAKTLRSINPHWNDEKLYQEARRLNIALAQHILFEEFYPILTGEKFYCPDAQCEYNSTVSGTTMNDFTTGVFRYVHAFTPTNFETYDKDGNLNGVFQISKIIDNTRILETNYHDVVRGLLYQGINLQNTFNDEVRNRLFNDSDLISIDIKRGRDHGLPPYWKYREFCGLPPVEKFSDLPPLISEQATNGFKSIYKSALDIDFYLGGGAEHKEGGLLGPTFKCITKIQFAHYKMGDRFFYTHRKSGYPFTTGQLHEIKQFSFAKLLCLTTGIQKVPVNAFLVPSKSNPIVTCSSMRQLDILPWLD